MENRRRKMPGPTLPMDYLVLAYLSGCGGSAPTIAIPARLFRGDIPAGAPSLVDLGLIKHDGEITSITSAGREAIAD